LHYSRNRLIVETAGKPSTTHDRAEDGMRLTEQQKRDIEKQAILDREQGEFTEYEGDKLVDVVFAPIDAIAGTPSTTEMAAEKQKYYNQVR
jgi:hypothetical protein